MTEIPAWARNNLDVIATVILTVTLVVLAPVEDLSVLGRVAVFAAIIVGVPTVVCLVGAAMRRRGWPRNDA